MLNNIPYEEIDIAIEKTIEQFKTIKNIDMNRMSKQIEIARRVLRAYSDGKKNVIVEAPTGFGKSILGFFMTIAVKNLDAKKTSYILTSNKFLQDQYDRDIQLFDLVDSHVLLKGQSNYTCSLINDTFTRRPCAHTSFNKIGEEQEFSNCVKTCTYVRKRFEAIHAQTAVFNYSYWLTSMNFVYSLLEGNAPFRPRTLTIFDESHLLGDIVQNMFGQDINIDRLVKNAKNLHTMVNYSKTVDIEIDEDIQSLQNVFNTLKNAEQSANCETEYTAINELNNAVSNLLSKLLKTVKEFDQKLLTDDQKRYLTFTESVTSLSNQLVILLSLYDTVGHDSIVLSVYVENNKVSKQDERRVSLRCTDEREIVRSKVLEYTKNGLFMSATFGDIRKYAEQNGIEDYEAIYVESDFDYSRSPIYHVVPSIKMTYAEKTKNMPILLDYVNKILQKHENERGIIHTGNFEFMQKLKCMNNKRFIFYTNAEEKVEAMRKLEIHKNAVICGPSILEGVDLKDDLARFCIFMKVPYQSIGDKLVKRKMEKYEGWYDWSTMIQFLQGLGRTVRHKNDYATTYLLDGSFQWFLRKNTLASYIRKRISSININNLDSNVDKEFDDMFS